MIDEQMRAFILLTEGLGAEVLAEKPVAETVVEETTSLNEVMLHDLEDTCFTLRAFMESDNSEDFALGVETGMQRAADMIENVIRRHTQGDN